MEQCNWEAQPFVTLYEDKLKFLDTLKFLELSLNKEIARYNEDLLFKDLPSIKANMQKF